MLTLTGAAPNGGVDVTLTSSDPATVVAPGSVKIKGGNTTATFNISTFAVTQPRDVTVSGSYGGLTQTATLTVIPASAITRKCGKRRSVFRSFHSAVPELSWCHSQ